MAFSVAHESKLYHGRLSPSKILLAFKDANLDEEDAIAQLKICDWGQTFILSADPVQAPPSKGVESMRYCVSPELADKELISDVVPGDYPKDIAASRNDIYALGASMYHMLTGSPPFADAKSKEALQSALATAPVKFSPRAWSNLSENCRDAIELMLKVNPSLRITPKKLLQHPWIKIAKTTFPKKRMVQLLNNLHMNTQHCQFTRFVLRIVAEQLPPDAKQAETVEDAFRCLDGNGDGVLSTEELSKGLTRYLGVDEKELKDMFAAIDRDGSGKLNVTEFLAATMDQRQCLQVSVLWQAFNAFDQDQSSHVTFDEIDQVVKEIEGTQMGKERLDALCAEIRAELDQVTMAKGQEKALDFDQFVYLMQNDVPSMKQAFKKDVYRMAWGRCGLDCYQIRHVPPEKSWKLHSPRAAGGPGGASRSTSAYRNRRKVQRKVDEEAAEQEAQPAG